MSNFNSSKKIAIALIAMMSCFATTALSQQVYDCNEVSFPGTSARAIVEPWEANTRTFSNNDVRITLLGYEDPGSGPLFIMVLSPPVPPFDGGSSRNCKLIGYSDVLGFGDVQFSKLEANYVPEQGLQFTVPVETYAFETQTFNSQALNFSLDQSNGQVKTDLESVE